MQEYVQPIVGGLLIGVAASCLLFLIGRIAGFSGILWNAVSDNNDDYWRWFFLAGLVTGTLLVHNFSNVPYPPAPAGGYSLALLGGVLVGFGTRLGSGCTSGHGVCGIARFSTRSIVATITFMASGVLTVSLLRHIFHLV